MNQPPFDSGDPPAVTANGHPDQPGTDSERSGGEAATGRDANGAAAGRDSNGAAAGSHTDGAAAGPHTNGVGATRANAHRLAQLLDWRLQSLRVGPAADAVPATSTLTVHQQRPRRGRLLAKVAAFVALAALAVLLLQAFVIQPFAVPGNAMAPTLQAGDRVLVLKAGLLEGPIRSGEIVVFHPSRSIPCAVVGGRGGDLVLRVVALPQQVIWSVGNTIFVNGRPLRERGWYDPRFGQVGATPVRSTVLAPDQYFVMADNRSAACDSRVFGPISRSSIVGKGIAVVGRHGHVFFGAL